MGSTKQAQASSGTVLTASGSDTVRGGGTDAFRGGTVLTATGCDAVRGGTVLTASGCDGPAAATGITVTVNVVVNQDRRHDDMVPQEVIITRSASFASPKSDTEPDVGKTVMTTGKHKNMTFNAIKTKDPDYVKWVLARNNHVDCMKDFHKFLVETAETTSRAKK